MALRLAGYEFEVPNDDDELKDESGVYAIVGNNGGVNWNVVDVGESESIKTRLADHERQESWYQQGYKNVRAAVLYTHKTGRMLVEKEVRQEYNPPCGER